MAKKKTLRDQYNDALKTIRESEEYSSSTIKQREAMEKMLDDEYKKAAELESLKQEEANIQALEEKKAQEEAKGQQIAAKRLEQLKSIPSDLRGLEAMRKSDSLYLAGGGTFGNVFTGRRQPTEMELGSGQYRKGEKVATLGSRFYDPAQGLTGLAGRSLSPNAKAINVVPARIGSGQMYSTLRSSGPYAMAPELYRRGEGTSGLDSSKKFYSTITGNTIGNIVGSWTGYDEKIGVPKTIRNKDYYPKQRGLTFPAISTPIGGFRSFA